MSQTAALIHAARIRRRWSLGQLAIELSEATGRPVMRRDLRGIEESETRRLPLWWIETIERLLKLPELVEICRRENRLIDHKDREEAAPAFQAQTPAPAPQAAAVPGRYDDVRGHYWRPTCEYTRTAFRPRWADVQETYG